MQSRDPQGSTQSDQRVVPRQSPSFKINDYPVSSDHCPAVSWGGQRVSVAMSTWVNNSRERVCRVWLLLLTWDLLLNYMAAFTVMSLHSASRCCWVVPSHWQGHTINICICLLFLMWTKQNHPGVNKKEGDKRGKQSSQEVCLALTQTHNNMVTYIFLQLNKDLMPVPDTHYNDI